MVIVKRDDLAVAQREVWRPDLEVDGAVVTVPAQPIVLYAGREHLDPSAWSVGAHEHEHHELLVIESGAQSCRFDNSAWSADAGTEATQGSGGVFLFAPRTSHAEWLQPDRSVRKLTLGFSCGGLRPVSPVGIDPGGRIHELARWIVRDLEISPQSSRHVAALLHALVEEFIRHNTLVEESPLLAHLRSRFESRPDETPSLAELAASVGLSRTVYATRFKAATGTTPRACLLRMRLERGRQLLTSTERPIKAIADELGFADVSHFTNAMRKWCGASPGEARRSSGRCG